MRKSVFLSFACLPMVFYLYTYENENTSAALIRLGYVTLVPGFGMAAILALFGDRTILLWSHFLIHITISVNWYFAVIAVAEHGSNHNYYTFLPAIAGTYLAFIMLFACYPKTVIAISTLEYMFITFWALYRDPTAKEQIGAFVLFVGLTMACLAYLFSFRDLFERLNVFSMNEKGFLLKIRQNHKLLDFAIHGAFDLIVGYDAKGEMVLEKHNDAKDGIRHIAAAIPKTSQELSTFWEEFAGTRVNANSSVQINADGQNFLLIWSQTPEMSICALIDITERVAQEKSLRQSQKLGMVGQLTSGIAHDYNNLLGIVINSIEAVPRETYSELWENNLNQAMSALYHATQISQKLLKVSGLRELEAQPVTLQNCIEEMRPLFESVVLDNISVKVTADTRAIISCDRNELESALLNLVVNSKNAIGKDRGEITIAATDMGEEAVITVSDNGPGIPEDIQEKIFEPYFSTHKTEYSSGLGLSTVHSFVQQSQGRLTLKSQPGNTEFSLIFPAIRIKSRLSSDPASPVGKKIRKPAGKVLFIDDNRVLIQSTKKLLEAHGQPVDIVSDWDAAAQMVTDTNYVAIFVDMSMPEGTGIDLIRALMELAPQPAYYILTGNPDQVTMQAAAQVSVCGVLSKPLRLATFSELAEREFAPEPGYEKETCPV